MLHSPPRALAPDFLAGRLPAPVQMPAPSVPAKASPKAAAPSSVGLEGVAGFGTAMGGPSGSEAKRKKIIMAAVVIMGIWTFFDESGSTPDSGKPGKGAAGNASEIKEKISK